MVDISQFTLPVDTGICLLDCTTAFEGLTDREKLYTHYISQASWYGGLIPLIQTSPESPGIFILLQKLFRAQPIAELEKIALSNDSTAEEFKALLVYTAGIYTNMGNYKSFGDSKFIPTMPKDNFVKLVRGSAAFQSEKSVMEPLLKGVSETMYSLSGREQQLGLGNKGITTYYSSNCDITDAKVAQEFLSAKDLSPYNTRLFKTVNPDSGKIMYEVRIASVETQGGVIPGCLDDIVGCHDFTPKDGQPVKFMVSRGDYSKLMLMITKNLGKAKEYAANEMEAKMLECYINSFTTGSIPSHKEGSRHWIKNKGPIVETYVGFIETYRDPFGVRGEFEGFVAVVNKEMSAKFGLLVDNAEHLLPLLPWSSEYEKDKFLRPDFTSLDVLTYGGSGIPAGINIPNYDDIRQDEGFKNVSLGNVLTSGYKDTKVTFLSEEDKKLYSELKLPAFEVQVGLHELLGHGSGKLFIKEKDGTFNFDRQTVMNTLTGEKISTWYDHTETWDSKFSVLASTYEECRAECVGLYLCLSADVLKIFGYIDDSADDIIYVNWLNMVRAGLLGLEYYSPGETGGWRQAHMQGRYVILRVLLEAGEGLITLTRTTGEDDKPDIVIKLDRSKINSVGKPAIGAFLQKLQVYKSTGDFANGSEMYGQYSQVTDNEEPHFLSLREIVIARKQPRKMFVQHNTFLEGDTVALKSYEGDAEGLIQSFVDRFPSNETDVCLQELWEKDSVHF